MKKKFSSFKAQINEIEKLLADGYTYKEANNWFLDNHKVNLSFGTFRNYLYRCRAENLVKPELAVKQNDKDINTFENKTNVEKHLDLKPEKTEQVFANRQSGENFISNLIDE